MAGRCRPSGRSRAVGGRGAPGHRRGEPGLRGGRRREGLGRWKRPRPLEKAPAADRNGALGAGRGLELPSKCLWRVTKSRGNPPKNAGRRRRGKPVAAQVAAAGGRAGLARRRASAPPAIGVKPGERISVRVAAFPYCVKALTSNEGPVPLWKAWGMRRVCARGMPVGLHQIQPRQRSLPAAAGSGAEATLERGYGFDAWFVA